MTTFAHKGITRNRPKISGPKNLRYNGSGLLKNNRQENILDEFKTFQKSKNSVTKINNLEQLKKVVDESGSRHLLKFVINDKRQLIVGKIHDGLTSIQTGDFDIGLKAIRSLSHPTLPFTNSSSTSVYSAGYVLGRIDNTYGFAFHSGHYMPKFESLGHAEALIRRWGGEFHPVRYWEPLMYI